MKRKRTRTEPDRISLKLQHRNCEDTPLYQSASSKLCSRYGIQRVRSDFELLLPPTIVERTASLSCTTAGTEIALVLKIVGNNWKQNQDFSVLIEPKSTQ